MFKGLRLPEGAMTSRQLIESRLESYIRENGAGVVADWAGITRVMLNRIRRGEREVSPSLAELLGYQSKKLRYFQPAKGEKRV